MDLISSLNLLAEVPSTPNSNDWVGCRVSAEAVPAASEISRPDASRVTTTAARPGRNQRRAVREVPAQNSKMRCSKVPVPDPLLFAPNLRPTSLPRDDDPRRPYRYIPVSSRGNLDAGTVAVKWSARVPMPALAQASPRVGSPLRWSVTVTFANVSVSRASQDSVT